MSLIKNAEEIGPGIYLFENVIDNQEELIYHAKQRATSGALYEAEIYSSLQEQILNKEIRNTKIVEISPVYKNNAMWWILSQKIWEYGNEYAMFHNISFSDMEHPQFLYYQKNQGFYSPHVDSASSKPRIISAVLYLNNVEEGGETYFEKFDVSVKPKSGRMILFPSNFVYIHGAKVPKSDDKYAVVTWFTP
jgi:predicted 2-oxoglutarate/Fe(II)-dependent dioxygenase YbiX